MVVPKARKHHAHTFAVIQGKMKEKQLTHRFSLTKTGATTDQYTPKGAIIMIITVFLYAIIQVRKHCSLSMEPSCPPPGWHG